MSALSHIEKQKLELEFGMPSGFVLNFSNRTFEEFFHEVVKTDIYSSRYALGSGSKANRLRAFWNAATPEQLRLFFEGILEGWSLYAPAPISPAGKQVIEQIIERFGGKGNGPAREKASTEIQISPTLANALNSELLALTSLQPQARGYAFEKFLKNLFNAYGLSARASFRNMGEQIDGSFVLHNETYLFEAKWQNSPTPADELHTFEGKLGQKAAWSRGLFISISGFSHDGLIAFGRAKRTICMDGFDLSEVFRNRLSLLDVLSAKVRIAAETGNPFTSVRDCDLR